MTREPDSGTISQIIIVIIRSINLFGTASSNWGENCSKGRTSGDDISSMYEKRETEVRSEIERKWDRKLDQEESETSGRRVVEKRKWADLELEACRRSYIPTGRYWPWLNPRGLKLSRDLYGDDFTSGGSDNRALIGAYNWLKIVHVVNLPTSNVLCIHHQSLISWVERGLIPTSFIDHNLWIY